MSHFGATARAADRFWLTTDTGSVLLRQGASILGRSPDCDVSFPRDDLMSRRHARFTVEGGAVTVEDLGSSNGTYVDGTKVNRPTELAAGAVVRAGSHHFQLEHGPSPPPSCKDTAPGVPKRSRDEDSTDAADLTPTAGTSELEAFLRSARRSDIPGQDAESLVPIVEMVEDEVRATGGTEPALAEGAAATALTLAVRTREASWIDRALHLYTRVAKPMPPRLLDALEVAVWQVGNVDATTLRHYARTLSGSAREGDSTTQAVRLRIEEQARFAERRGRSAGGSR